MACDTQSALADFSAVHVAFHLHMSTLGATCWLECVGSRSSPADGGSRAGAANFRRGLAIDLTFRRLNDLPSFEALLDIAMLLSLLPAKDAVPMRGVALVLPLSGSNVASYWELLWPSILTADKVSYYATCKHKKKGARDALLDKSDARTFNIFQHLC